MTRERKIRYGLIGAGVFGRFSIASYQSMKQLVPVAVADVVQDAADAAAAEYGIEACRSVDALLERRDVDLVHIATPPHTHRSLAEKAIAGGKHVLCEKPLALGVSDARAMIDAARDNGRILAVNLIMRYDPLCEAVKSILDEQLLGLPLHGFFENYAQDQSLGPDHWFWDEQRSGGIFIEHGVHFFDLYAWWLGTGRILAAQHVQRPGHPGIVEQVHCTTDYVAADVAAPAGERANHVLVNFYHGFTQPGCMDRQEMRIVCERGTIRLFEWVPTELEIDCVADQARIDRMAELLPNARVSRTQTYRGADRQLASRFKSYPVDGRYCLSSDNNMTKPELYGFMVRALLADQVRAIHEPHHSRRISEANGLESLRMAAEAYRTATGT